MPSSESTVRRSLRIRGRVQGVGFRQATCEQARKLVGITGFVRNAPDGSVLVEVQGPATSVESLVRWLWRGPPSAEVLGVDETVASAAPLGSFRVL